MFTKEQLNPARNIGESFPAYKRRRIRVAADVEDHLRRGTLLWPGTSTFNAGRNAAKRLRKLAFSRTPV